MTNRKTDWKTIIIGLLLLAAGIFSLFYWGNRKQVWFCDEIYTYESANGFEQDWPASCTAQWITGKDVEAFFAADTDTLSLNDITVRLYNDHVPLYFWLFRMVSLFFFKGSGTIWIGLGMNLVFYLIFLVLAYCLFLRLTDNPVVSGAAIILTCIVNRLMIEQITVLRMYMMLLLAEGMLLLGGFWILRMAEKNKISPGGFIYLFIVSLFGFLTHYDYWVFYASTATAFCLWLLIAAIRKAGKKFWASTQFRCVAAWAADFVLALFTTIRLFPYCRWNLNRGKGQTALLSLFDFSGKKFEQILWGYRRLVTAIFGDAFPVPLGLFLVFGCIVGGMVLLYRKREYRKFAGLLLSVFTAQIYQLIVCFTMPDALEERYLWGGFIIMMFCMAFGGILLLQALFSTVEYPAASYGVFHPRGNRQISAQVRLLGSLLAGIKNQKTSQIIRWTTGILLSTCILAVEIAVIDSGNGIAYLFHPDKNVELLRENSDIPWIVYGPTVGVYSYYDWLIPEKICFLTENNTPEDAAAVKELQDEKFVLYIYEDYLPDALAFFEQELGNDLKAEPLTKSTNLTVYLVQ